MFRVRINICILWIACSATVLALIFPLIMAAEHPHTTPTSPTDESY